MDTTASLMTDGDKRWVLAHVRHYRPSNLRPQYWPGMNGARQVALDWAMECGLVECASFPSGATLHSVTDAGFRAIRAAVKAGAR